MSNTQLTTLANKLASKFELGDGQGLLDTLKKTAFKTSVTDDQMVALLIVANQYQLNPWTSEIYAFPSKTGGVTPVVGVDGWARIINSNDSFDGIEFEQDADSCTCKIYRKDRAHPISVTEFMDECKGSSGPWRTHPRRMLRHKAMIQCARLAFGFAGIYDEDEAERIKDARDGIKSGEISPFAGQNDNPERAGLLQTAEAVAMRGIEEYQGWWQNITPAQRKIIGTDEHNRLKDIASNTINAAAVDINQDDNIPL